MQQAECRVWLATSVTHRQETPAPAHRPHTDINIIIPLIQYRFEEDRLRTVFDVYFLSLKYSSKAGENRGKIL